MFIVKGFIICMVITWTWFFSNIIHLIRVEKRLRINKCLKNSLFNGHHIQKLYWRMVQHYYWTTSIPCNRSQPYDLKRMVEVIYSYFFDCIIRTVQSQIEDLNCLPRQTHTAVNLNWSEVILTFHYSFDLFSRSWFLWYVLLIRNWSYPLL
jgi:hypothetical protein